MGMVYVGKYTIPMDPMGMNFQHHIAEESWVNATSNMLWIRRARSSASLKSMHG